MIGKVRLSKNPNANGDEEAIVLPSTAYTNKTSKNKNKINGQQSIEDLRLEDVNDDFNEDGDRIKSKKKNTTRSTSKKTVKNAFYN